MTIGPNYLDDNSCEFTVWAPSVSNVQLKINFPENRICKMEKDDKGYWKVVVPNTNPESEYFYLLNNNTERPDPASHFQPYGVHGPSKVVDHKSYNWNDENWKGLLVKDLIIYEIHIGTFTNEGTFESAINKLDHLINLGITAIEVMPISQFSGKRNWGYDGAYPFAPQNTYGGPNGLKELVQACHDKGLAVILDVVYNHFGPEGCYIRDFGPYFTSKYKTPWGNALNFDDEYSDEVRNFFIENVIHWLGNYHIDGFRLDAIDKIYDLSAKHLLDELSETVDEYSQGDDKFHFLIAESDLNDRKIITPHNENGFGFHAQWSDDFHHSLHALLTKETSGYYVDFGKVKHLVSAMKNSFVYSGIYSKYRKRRHGNIAVECPPYQFVNCTQNHDQVGNRAFGERLSQLVSFEALKIAAGALFLTPNIPLIFMGEEYGETAPFIYFISHEDKNLVSAVQEGRREEFKAFEWNDDIPDPNDKHTFNESKLDWNKINKGKHSTLLKLYKTLINFRKVIPALDNTDRNNFEVTDVDDKLILLRRWFADNEVFIIFNFTENTITHMIDVPEGNWNKLLDSSSEKWNGPGESLLENLIGHSQNITIKPYSFAVYGKETIS
ncbi:MAG TPA: malto-oligosyltrehalose trehalohydrolase [Ignavibacteriaceae bacterium]|nr:malto-oligosyltrehalose trehalohydrolase [Ignavibacteriaceae bacterium]